MEKLESKYIKEQKRYTVKQLCDVFHKTESEIVPLISKLKSYNVLKAVNKKDAFKDLSDLSEDDFVVAPVVEGDDSLLYVFTFVGIINVAGIILKCYPKYIENNDSPKDELKQAIKVIRKINAREQHIDISTDEEGKDKFNLLSMLLFLLNDYYENGIYSNSQTIVESNGTGEILWDKTINEVYAVITNNRPVYPELYSRKQELDDNNYFTRLHRSIITTISADLESADVLDFFDLSPAELSDEEIEDFGDKDYILYRLEKELNTQFNTRKQILLKAIISYIGRRSTLRDTSDMSNYGTNCFHVVWEKACGAVLENQLEENVKDIVKNPKRADAFNYTGRTLLDVIEPSKWMLYGSDKGAYSEGKYIPDIALIRNDRLYIYDAKYYHLRLSDDKKSVLGAPGIESVSKQYFYQLAYSSFLENMGYDPNRTVNAFLFPKESGETEKIGEVYHDAFENIKQLKPIQVILLPAPEIYAKFLNNEKIDICDFFTEEETPMPPVDDSAWEVEEQPNGDNLIWLPVFSSAAAGYGTDMQEEEIGYLPVERNALHPLEKGKYFYVQINGESMIDSGINDGDYVLVRRSSVPDDGDIVIFRIDNDHGVIKTLEKHNGYISLIPSNESYDPITVLKGNIENNSAGYVGVVQKKYTRFGEDTHLYDRSEIPQVNSL